MKKLIWMGSSREDLRAFPRQARLYLSRDAPGRNLCLALLPKEDAEHKPPGFGLGGKTI
jgi:hypothetical protein